MEAILAIFSITTLSSVLAASAPVVFASLGETLNERAGVINLSVEGTMMLGAMVGFAAAQKTGNVVWGFAAAMLVGMVMASIVAFGSITLNRDQVAIGFILTLLGIELSSFLGAPYVRQPGPRIAPLPIPILQDIPVIGPLFFEHDMVTYLSFALAIGMWVWFYKTQPGLKLRGIGERPQAAFARGVNVVRLRYLYTLIGGALIGFSGAAFSLHVKLGWSHRHTDGFGWIALAIVIFGGWHPIRVLFGAYFFGLLRAAATTMQQVMPGVPVQVFPLLPFPLMIMILIIFNTDFVVERLFYYLPVWLRRHLKGFLRSQPPAALGTRFEQE
jgi:simple sugar transport system permease protein